MARVETVRCPRCHRPLRLTAADFPLSCCGRRYATIDEMRSAAPEPGRSVPPQPPIAQLTPAESAELFPGEPDPTLLGNRIAALTSAIGIPPCGGCSKRKAWLNKAHAWLRSLAG